MLTECLSNNDDVETALQQFEKQRLPRVKRIAKTARSNGNIYHLSGPSAVVRNIGLLNVSGQYILHNQDWIYRWKP